MKCNQICPRGHFSWPKTVDLFWDMARGEECKLPMITMATIACKAKYVYLVIWIILKLIKLTIINCHD